MLHGDASHPQDLFLLHETDDHACISPMAMSPLLLQQKHLQFPSATAQPHMHCSEQQCPLVWPHCNAQRANHVNAKIDARHQDDVLIRFEANRCQDNTTCGISLPLLYGHN